MTVSLTQLRAQVGTSETTLPNAAGEALLSVALKLVTKHAGDSFADVPAEVVDRAVLLVAAEQFEQDKAPNGIANQAFDLTAAQDVPVPVRISRDPLKPAYPVLAPWISGRFFCA